MVTVIDASRLTPAETEELRRALTRYRTMLRRNVASRPLSVVAQDSSWRIYLVETMLHELGAR